MGYWNRIWAATVASGSSLFEASEDGNIYSLNTDQKVGPTSTYLYYYVAAIIILIGVGCGIKKLHNKPRK